MSSVIEVDPRLLLKLTNDLHVSSSTRRLGDAPGAGDKILLRTILCGLGLSLNTGRAPKIFGTGRKNMISARSRRASLLSREDKERVDL